MGARDAWGSYGKTALPEWPHYLLVLLGEAFMVIKRASSNHKPLTQLIHESPKNAPPPTPPQFNQRPQPGWEVPNNCLPTSESLFPTGFTGHRA